MPSGVVRFAGFVRFVRFEPPICPKGREPWPETKKGVSRETLGSGRRQCAPSAERSTWPPTWPHSRKNLENLENTMKNIEKNTENFENIESH